MNIIVDCDEFISPLHFDSFNEPLDILESDERLSVFIATAGHVDYMADQQSLSSPQSVFWEAARQDELSSCRSNVTLGPLMDLPEGHKAVNLGFVYALKQSQTAAPRYKALLVFKNHAFATDSTWEETCSPVVDKSALRIFFP